MSAAPELAPAAAEDSPRMVAAGDRSFSRRTLGWLVAAGIVSLAATLVIPILGEDTAPREPVSDPSAYSRSAIGHHAFVALMEELGLTVLVSRNRPAERANVRRPLLVAEPTVYEPGELRDLAVAALERGAPVVVVLPKWAGEPLRSKEGWVRELAPVDASVVEDVLSELDAAARVMRGEGVEGEWSDMHGASFVIGGEADWRAAWDTPTGIVVAGVQVVDGEAVGLEAVLWGAPSTEEEVLPTLIGGFEGLDLFVIADPDLMSTRGLAAGDNAVVLYRFFADYLGAEGLVMDELMHGFAPKSESIWAELTSFPLILLTAHLLGLLALALWATTSRFGKPMERPPRIAPGKRTLIESTATLLALGGHVGHGLREYLRGTVRALAREYALSPQLSDGERLETLARLGAERGVSVDLKDLAARADEVRDTRRESRRAVALARKIYRFRMEMTHGYRGHR